MHFIPSLFSWKWLNFLISKVKYIKNLKKKFQAEKLRFLKSVFCILPIWFHHICLHVVLQPKFISSITLHVKKALANISGPVLDTYKT